MKMDTNKNVWTVGHSTRSLEDFIALLQYFEISVLADIRTFPGSRRYPHFNKDALAESLRQCNIRYIHFPALGGRRKPDPESVNTAWRHPSFKGYADHMGSAEFKNAVEQLESFAKSERLAFMCSELLWWKCHRSLVSDFLKVNGWTVHHIVDIGKSQIHPYTSPAKEIQGKLFYN
jgi:uncharacterized protein (DUF488 family)